MSYTGIFMTILEKYFEKNSVYLSICGKRLYIGSIILKKQVIWASKQQFNNLESNPITPVSLNTSLVSLKTALLASN